MKKEYQFPRVKVIDMMPDAPVLQTTGSIAETGEG